MIDTSPQTYSQPLQQDLSASADDRNFASWIHLSLYSTIVLNMFGLIIPFVLWYSRKDQSRFIDSHGKSVLNFMTTIFFAFLFLLSVLLAGFIVFNVNLFQQFTSGGAFDLPWYAWSVPIFVGIGGLLTTIVLCILPVFGFSAANSGREYKYPLAISFFK